MKQTTFKDILKYFNEKSENFYMQFTHAGHFNIYLKNTRNLYKSYFPTKFQDVNGYNLKYVDELLKDIDV